MDFRENLLNLYYHKNLHYKNTTIIILFTYITGIIVAFLTNQLDITNNIDLIFIITLSTAVFTIGILFLNEFNYHLKKIPKEIKKLNSI